MEKPRESRKQTLSFTLTETLVGVGVLSLLASMILPALSDTMANARAAYCMNNLKQWGVGFRLYAADWNGYLPSEGTAQCIGFKEMWFNAVPPYLKMLPYKDLPGVGSAIQPLERLRIWVCPEKNLRNPKSVSGKNSVFYGMNGYLDGDTTDDCNHHNRHVKLSWISKPDVTVLLCDVYTSQFYCDPMDTAFRSYPWQENGVGLHQNGANFLFVDGHVSWFPVSAYWTGSNGITNNPVLRWYR